MSENKTDFHELIQKVETLFLEQIPFNKLLGMHIETLDFESAKIKIEMRDELIGNFIQRTLHGGVISSALDVIGGLTAFMTLLKKMERATSQEKLERLAKFGTIDLRVDYLRPGRGKFFIAQGTVLRTGSKIAVTSMELHNDEQVLIAVGTGTYVVV